MTWLAAGVVPGVWLILSGWSPELVPDRKGGASSSGSAPGPSADIECQALALALRPSGTDPGADAEAPRFQLRIGERPAPEDVAAPIDLVRLARDLEGPGGPPCRTVATDPAGRVRVELVREWLVASG
jgi:hypothetical protein